MNKLRSVLLWFFLDFRVGLDNYKYHKNIGVGIIAKIKILGLVFFVHFSVNVFPYSVSCWHIFKKIV